MTDITPHILVVDDHQEIRDLLGRYLREHGLQVSLAENGERMKLCIQGERIDLVVLDIMMPGEDGLTLCRHLREHTRLPVILLTACGEATDRIVGLEMGADHYVTKPFNPRDALKRALRNLIDNTLKYGQCADIYLQTSELSDEIHIQDQGPGIHPDEQERVFEPFYRLENSRNRQTGGSGLGLAIARTLIRQQGGEIRLHNRTPGLDVAVILPR